MANRQDIEATYDYMDEIFRLTFGETADISCAMFEGDWGRPLAAAQDAKHRFILEGLGVSRGSRLLDIGCGWGPLLRAAQERGIEAIGLTLSPKQAAACRRNGLDARLLDWSDPAVRQLGSFDAIACVGAFEHFCSVESYVAGEQEQTYQRFFEICSDLLQPGGRLFVQTMYQGRHAPPFSALSLGAPKGTVEHVAAMVCHFYPNSWPPASIDSILGCARPRFELVSEQNGRLDYIETMRRWSAVWQPTPRKLLAATRLIPRYLASHDLRLRVESLRRGYNRQCFEREILDHTRLHFARVT